jgi:hypothetical protein
LIVSSRYEHGGKRDLGGSEVILEEILSRIAVPL